MHIRLFYYLCTLLACIYKQHIYHGSKQRCNSSVSGNGEIDINEGALTENFVAVELNKHGHTLHYYDRKSRNELDFLIREDKKVTIVEVKSGNNYEQHVALDNVLDEQSEFVERSIVLNKKQYKQVDDITYLPLYMAMWL